MSEGSAGMTGLSVKEINKRLVLSCLYQEEKGITKQGLVNKLNMSLSTVDQNLKQLTAEGLCCELGFENSRGGRKAKLMGINRTHKIAAGLGILKGSVHLNATDLYGTIIASEEIALPYSNDSWYFKALGEELRRFLREHELNPEDLLPITAAVQGLTSLDGTEITFGVLLNNTHLKASTLSEALGFPVVLCHDSYCAAIFEIWHNPDIKTGSLFLLNRNFGGAAIFERTVLKGKEGRSGVLEHYCIDETGPRCYCGCQGCLEVYCSADALKQAAGCSIEEFFRKLREGDPFCVSLWDKYLKILSVPMRNSLCLTDSSIILCGYLEPYFVDEDFDKLLNNINANIAFKIDQSRFIRGRGGDKGPSLGAALYSLYPYIKENILYEGR